VDRLKLLVLPGEGPAGGGTALAYWFGPSAGCSAPARPLHVSSKPIRSTVSEQGINTEESMSTEQIAMDKYGQIVFPLLILMVPGFKSAATGIYMLWLDWTPMVVFGV
jgi:hypothetical protein